MSVTERWLDWLTGFLLPAACLGCGVSLSGRRAPRLGLCPPCRGRLARPARPACATCGRPLEAAAMPASHRCGACRANPPAFDLLLAGWSYEPPFDSLVRGLKFGRLDYLGRHLAEELARELVAGDGVPRLEDLDAVVPVPLHWWRKWSRGYDQATSIARPLARCLGLPLAPVLRRRRPTRPQSRLARRDRLANVAGAFGLRRGAEVGGRGLLLVDDVTTTGATLRAAAAVLRAAGARRIVALAAGIRHEACLK